MPANWPRDLEMSSEVPQMFNNDGGDQVIPIGRSRYAGTINSVEFIPGWNLTGANTNSRTFTLFNRRSTGTGTTTVAQVLMTSGSSMTRNVAFSVSITSANAAIAPGDILEWQSLHVGNGLPDPGGRIVVQHSLTN